MKLKVLIVDDEPIICRGLRETVPWNELSAEVIGEAYDGDEAFSILKELEADLVLSDVKMPIMDGISLAEKISKHFSHIKLILISGYDEFEYAKRAMRLGVKDYLLKPVDIDELMNLITNIKMDLLKENQKVWSYTLKQVLSSIAMGQHFNENSDQINKLGQYEYQLIGSQIENYSEQVMTLSADEIHHFKQTWINQMDKEIEEGGRIGVSLFIGENRMVTCCRICKGEQLDSQELNSMLMGIEKKINRNVFMSFSPVSKSLNDITVLYHNLLNGMRAHPFTKKRVLEAEGIEQTLLKETPDFFVNSLNKWHQGEAINLNKMVEDLFTYFKMNRWYLEDVAVTLKNIEENVFMEYEEDLNFKLKQNVDVTIYNSYNQLKRLFLDDLLLFSSYQESALKEGQRWLIKKALTYIKEHFSCDIKAVEVANFINVSPNYFSHMIKQETGKHFNDYLHGIRINETKKLLKETTYRIFEIAEMVGYRDYKYFVHNFKKITNLTPSQYRAISTHRFDMEDDD
jgi:two-component system response regulator YesN